MKATRREALKGALAVPAVAAVPTAAWARGGKAVLVHDPALAAGRRLATACRFLATDFFPGFGRVLAFTAGRLPERERGAGVRLASRPALRLAMMKSSWNLDSFTISVVLSVAYRKSGIPFRGLSAC